MLVEFEHRVEVDTDGWLAPEDILRRHRWDFDSLEDAIEFLRANDVDTDAFDVPWKMDYPL